MHPYRLIALVIIALFALGYARLLIDTGVREESPDPEIEVDLYARAACTAVGDPTSEALGIEWTHEVFESDGRRGCRLRSTVADTSAAKEAYIAVDRVFIMAKWQRRPGTTDVESATYYRRPVTCTASLDSASVSISCASMPGRL